MCTYARVYCRRVHMSMCLIMIGLFLEKSPMISGSFAERAFLHILKTPACSSMYIATRMCNNTLSTKEPLIIGLFCGKSLSTHSQNTSLLLNVLRSATISLDIVFTTWKFLLPGATTWCNDIADFTTWWCN